MTMAAAKKNTGKRKNISLSGILRSLEAIPFLRFEWFRQNIPFVLFLMLLSVIYIWNNHKGVRMVREYKTAEESMTEVLWNYNSLKDELTRNSRQTRVADMVKEDGMYELTDPPYTIIYND